MKKFFIKTYGCQMNVNDSEIVSSILVKAGFERVGKMDSADIILFNSCSVREHAEERVRGRITQEGSRKNSSNFPIIGLLGCVAQRNGNSLLQEIDALDFTLGTDQYRKLPDIINKVINNKDKYGFDQQNSSEIYEDIKPLRNTSVNAFVTIMRGCDNFCTYCIVPYVRGRERSRSIDKILTEVRRAGQNGYKDLTLLGQNVNSYNYKDYDFASLLKKAASIDTIRRLRFITSHPKDISGEVIATMAEEDRICESIHLPLQSASNKILKKMNRKYNYEKYFDIISELRTAIPDIAITTDVMVGFPGETEADFLETYNALKNIKFDYSFTFKYSPRPGTKAVEYSDQIPENIRLDRLQKLIDLQTVITEQKYQDLVGIQTTVYVEQVSRKDSKELSGRTRDNKIAVFPGKKELIGSFVEIKVTDAVGWTLRGKQIK